MHIYIYIGREREIELEEEEEEKEKKKMKTKTTEIQFSLKLDFFLPLLFATAAATAADVRSSRPLIPGRSRISLPPRPRHHAVYVRYIKTTSFFFFMVKIFPKENEGKRSREKSALDLAGGGAVGVRGAGRKNVIHEEQTIFSEIFIIHTRLNLLKRHSLSVTFMYIYIYNMYIYYYYYYY